MQLTRVLVILFASLQKFCALREKEYITARGLLSRAACRSSARRQPHLAPPTHVGAGFHPPGVRSPPALWRCVRLRAAGAARKGGTPGEGSPFNPLLRFFSTGEFRALRRASMGSAPGPRPLFCKKAGQKTFTWLDFHQPKPLALGASDSIRPRSGHLSGRVAPPTRVGEAGGSRNLTGASPPQAPFFGAPPRFFGQAPKKWGGIGSTR